MHAFSEIFRTKVSKDNAHPARFYRPLEYLRTLRGVKNARLTHSQKYLVLRFLKIIRTPHFFAVLSSTLRTLRGVKNARLHAFSEIFGVKVSKDNTHPARFYRSLEYPCTLRNAKNARMHAFSEIFRTKVSKDNAHPARFYRPLEYLRTLRGVKNARLHAFSEIFGIKVSLVLRFLKITRTPHAFIVLSSTLVKCVLGDSENCGNLHLAEKQLSSQTE